MELLILFVSTIILALLYHFTYTWYKEREWRRNNPDEHKIMNEPVKKDPDGKQYKMNDRIWDKRWTK